MRVVPLLSLLAVALASCRAADSEYFGYLGNGDKPTIGLRFKVHDGTVVGGTYSILSPEYPEKKEGVDYPMTDVSESEGVVHFTVRLKNGDAVTPFEYRAKVLRQSDARMELELSHADRKDEPPRTFVLDAVK